MHRRSFLLSLAGASPLICGPRPEPARITRIRVAQARGRFHKLVAMNAYDKAPKGDTYEQPLIRIETSRGIEGIGTGTYANPDDAFFESIRPLIGADPMELFTMQDGYITGPSAKFAPILARYPHMDSALFDLVGKLTGKPAWQLIGKSVRDRIEAYDGTLYFSDVLHPDRGIAAVVDECKEAVRAGYPALKLKLGRNLKWMPGAPGRERDIQVVRVVREALGSGVRIMGDANNGYKDEFDNAWSLLEKTKTDKLYWIEEIFPETVEDYTRLKDKLEAAHMPTKIADGENFTKPSQFEPYLKPRVLMDVTQLDVRRGGFLGSLESARMAEEAGAVAIPHNWGSQIGVLMAIHLSKAARGVPMVEDDRSRLETIVASGYKFENGSYTVSSEPGLGLRIDESIYAEQCAPHERIV
jgi:D-galactarolactone cycloisomerase